MSEMKGFVYDKSLGIYVDTKALYLEYADGSEQYLSEVFRNIEHVDSYPIELQKHIKDWPSRYHLSYMRTNLLEAIAELFDRDWNVLEVGAGTGALTPWLCETFNHVDCIEGALERAKTLRMRTKNLQNLRIFAGDIKKTSLHEEYDFVTLVGVLEYAPFYDSKRDPIVVCTEFLKHLGQGLKEDGLLLISIENKIGAKYFAGCAEDHNRLLFSGIMDYPDNSPVTFSRNEIENILKQAGFQESKFYHVFPDYKLPSTFIKENPAMYDLGISGFIRGLFEDRTGSREFFFHDALFVHTLLKARLLHQLSNSFLILCSKKPGKNLETTWLVKKFWNQEGTNPVFHHTISLVEDDSEYLVERRPMNTGIVHGTSGNVEFLISPKKTFIRGTSVLIEAYKAALMHTCRDKLWELIKEIYSNFLSMYSTGSIDSSGYPLVQGDKIDFCFWNLVRTDVGTLEFIDDKWKLCHDIPADFIIFRNLLYLYREVYPFVQENALSEFVMPIMRYLFPSYSAQRFEENLRQESDFQSSIRIDPIRITDELYSESDKSNLVGFSNLRNMLNQKERYIMELQSGKGWRLLNSYYILKARIVRWIDRT